MTTQAFIEWDLNRHVWQFRFADQYMPFMGERRWSSLTDAKAFFGKHGYELLKSDTLTYLLVKGV